MHEEPDVKTICHLIEISHPISILLSTNNVLGKRKGTLPLTNTCGIPRIVLSLDFLYMCFRLAKDVRVTRNAHGIPIHLLASLWP